MGELDEVLSSTVCRLNPQFFDRLHSEELFQIRHNLDAVLEQCEPHRSPFDVAPKLIAPGITDLVPVGNRALRKNVIATEAEVVLSPSQVRTFLGCSAKWWFKYGLHLPEPKTASLALGLAIHSALEVNFREKLQTGKDLETAGMVMIFRDAWREQVGETEFREDEDPAELGQVGEQLIVKYMQEAAPTIEPAAVELPVEGCVAGVPVRGRIDLMDVTGRVTDVKTAARRPSCVSPDYAFQLATYRQLTRGASGEARLDTLVRTKTVQLVRHDYTVSDQDLLATQVIYPLVREGMQNGLYFPNRQSMLCSRRHCAYWRQCEKEFGGTLAES
ncbi:MAG: PD-(D/E)XK nuclease family protein [Acidobacteriales bacterium]|nr:PD-(D/E)XK nuclease family protein [Terriglobales bacterium]